MIDFYAAEPHYLDHLAPVWHALDDSLRGVFWAATGLAGRAARAGIPVTLRPQPPKGGRLTVVAGYKDELRCRPRPVVLLEHGAGQHYVDGNGAGHPSYSGGGEHRQVRLFLCPNETVADRWRRAYPETPAVVVGCPEMDRWHPPAGRRAHRAPTVAVSFHWDCRVVPETRSAFGYYLPALAGLAAACPGRVLGHAHPRLFKRVAHLYAAAGLRPVADFADVLDLADVYACDNSSTIFEFASTGRPVVVLNAPWFRRDVEHGLRFWSHAGVGVQVDGPRGLVDGIRQALDDPPEQAALRDALSDDVYTWRDGRAAARAAAAIAALHAREVYAA